MLTAITSIFTQRRVRHTVAMTGEITLRGLVLPVGGIKEKVLAAKRAGIKKVVLPEKNRKDVLEIEGDALKGLSVEYVTRMEDVLEIVLTKRPRRKPESFFEVPAEEIQRSRPNNGGAGQIVSV